MVGVSLGTLGVLIIGTAEVSLVGLSLGLSLGSPLEYKNTGYVLPGMLIGAPFSLWFGSEAVRYCYPPPPAAPWIAAKILTVGG